MRALLPALKIIIAIHLLAALGFIGWLAGTNRLTMDRIETVVQLFSMTVEEQKAREQAEEAKRLAEEADAIEATRLEMIADGPITVQQRVDRQNVASEVTRARIARLQEQIRVMQADFALKQAELEKESAKLRAEMDAFNAMRDSFITQTTDEDFQRVLQILERQQARQSKTLILQMIQEGDIEKTVALLRAMRPATASEIIGQFRTPEEVRHAVELLRRLNADRDSTATANQGDWEVEP